MADEKENILNQTSSCIDTLKKLYRHGTRFTVYFSARINKGLSFLPYTRVRVVMSNVRTGSDGGR